LPELKLLLDECVDRRLAHAIIGHEVKTTPQMGWAGLRNGALLARAVAEGFDIFITVDRNLSFQQPLEKYPISVVVLHGKSNRIEDLLSLIPQLLRALQFPKTGQVVDVWAAV
jgi:hypothetical protein